MSIRKILIAVDEQPVSVRAAEVGAELARALGGEVALIHVGDPGHMSDTGMAPGEFAGRVKEESERLLAGFLERLALPPATLRFILSGAPAPQSSEQLRNGLPTSSSWPATGVPG